MRRALKQRQPLSRRDTGKLSDRLVELIALYEDGIAEPDDYKKLIAVASVAWNLSLFPLNKREDAIMEALERAPVPDRELILRMIRDLLHRKELLLPEDRRMVASYEVVDEGDNFHITVVSLSAK